MAFDVSVDGQHAIQLERIREKLAVLREKDRSLVVHGSSAHRYMLEPVLSPLEADAFKQKFGASLPDEYVSFLTHLGNGGAGPGYGLYSLAKSVEEFRGQQEWATKKSRPIPRLDQEFPLTAAVAGVLITCRRNRFRGNFNPHVATAYRLDGIMDICHHGCTAYEAIVLSGEQRGCVWGSSGPGFRWGVRGPGPGGQGFLAWYESWLDESLAPRNVERWAQGLAKSILAENLNSDAARAEFGFRLCLARRPAEAESDGLVTLFRDELVRFRKNEAAAITLIGGKPPEGVDTAELAAWTVAVNMLLNLDEFLTWG